jgi:hypothetical protein
MASRINQPISNPYGGAALLDSTPYLQLHLQKQAEEGAKVAAAQKAYDDLLKDPNPEGLREVDTKGFYDRVNQWREFGIKNKELVKDPSKDGGRARNELMRRANEIALYTQSSKDRKAQQSQFAPIFQNPETARRLKNSFLGQYSELQKPLDQSQAFQFNPTNIFRAKEFDQKKFTDVLLSGENPSEKLLKTIRPKGSLKETEVYEIQYSNPKKIGDKARNYYKTDDSMQEAIDELYEAEGMQLDANGKVIRPASPNMVRLNELYVKTYGKPIQTKDDLAAAYGLSVVPSKREQDKVVSNKAAEMAKADELAKGRMSYGFSLRQPKEPETVKVEDWETLVKSPDTRDNAGVLNLSKANDVIRKYSAATVNNVGDGAFIMPLPLASSVKADVANDPKYNKTVDEATTNIKSVLESADPINQKELASAAKNFDNELRNITKSKGDNTSKNEQRRVAWAGALNAINKANGVTQRYTADDLRKETPVLVKYQKGDKLLTAVVKLGTQEFRTAYDAAKKAYKKANTTNVSESSYGSQSSMLAGSDAATADDL